MGATSRFGISRNRVSPSPLLCRLFNKERFLMSKGSILVVDDDESTRTYLSRFLSSRGYTVETVESGEMASARLAAGSPPKVVLLDLVLPGMGGKEALAKWRRMY